MSASTWTGINKVRAGSCAERYPRRTVCKQLILDRFAFNWKVSEGVLFYVERLVSIEFNYFVILCSIPRRCYINGELIMIKKIYNQKLQNGCFNPKKKFYIAQVKSRRFINKSAFIELNH